MCRCDVIDILSLNLSCCPTICDCKKCKNKIECDMAFRVMRFNYNDIYNEFAMVYSEGE